MTISLRFRTSPSAACMRAVWCLRQGIPLTDAQLAEAIRRPAEELFATISIAGWPVDALLLELLNLAADVDNNRQLAEQAARRTVGPQAASSSHLTRVGGAIADLESCVANIQSTPNEELDVRRRPLQEQIEARVPGMLRQIGQLADPLLLPANAECVLVAPASGGGGTAHPRTNRIVQEAVLVNPLPELPEAVRAAWLIAQLNLDLPKFTESLPTGGLQSIGPLAMIPVTLAAGEAVELTTLDRTMLATALRSWHVPVADASVTAEVLKTWWTTYCESSAPWPVAMAALAQMHHAT